MERYANIIIALGVIVLLVLVYLLLSSSHTQ